MKRSRPPRHRIQGSDTDIPRLGTPYGGIAMAYEAKNYDHLKGGAVKGLSDSQLDQHFTLYKGYIAKLNEIEEKLASADNTKPNYSFNEYSELKRREAVAFNGSFLHELYFENLGADDTISGELQKAMDAQGGKEKLLADLK